MSPVPLQYSSHASASERVPVPTDCQLKHPRRLTVETNIRLAACSAAVIDKFVRTKPDFSAALPRNSHVALIRQPRQLYTARTLVHRSYTVLPVVVRDKVAYDQCLSSVGNSPPGHLSIGISRSPSLLIRLITSLRHPSLPLLSSTP